MSSPAWQRPASAPPIPSVYHRYTGLLDMPDGRKPNFWIQDATPDRYEEIVDFMCDSFLKEETMCATTHVRDDPVSLGEVRELWRSMLNQNVALMALTDWPDGPDKPRLAGCNVTCVHARGEHLPEFKGVPIKKVIGALHFIETKLDLFSLYGVNEFLTALGLSVSPEFRGQDLGRQILFARDALCRALGLNLTVTVFTGVASQKQSERAGFELVTEQRYDEYKQDGVIVFPKTPNDVFQLKIKKVQ